MNDHQKIITVKDAKNIVEQAAKERLQSYIKDKKTSLLSERIEEVEHCWFFFRNEDIVGAPDRALQWGWAYAISKKGEVSIIGDLSHDPIALNEYLNKMSNYFKERGL